MRMNLLTKVSGPVGSGTAPLPLSLTLRPSCGLPGDYVIPTNSRTLMRMLETTDLPSAVLNRFKGELYKSSQARLLGVSLSEQTLTEIGYFID